MRKLALFALLFATTNTAALAGVILSVTGPDASFDPGILPSQTLAIQFTVGRAYSAVSIRPDLIGSFSGTAYLMTQVGPGTTPIHEVAAGTFHSTDGPVTVLGSLAIPAAGTYYLVLSTEDYNLPQGLHLTQAPIVNAAPGAEIGPVFFSDVQGTEYRPSGLFYPITFDGSARIAIESVPEPGTGSLLLLSIAPLVILRMLQTLAV